MKLHTLLSFLDLHTFGYLILGTVCPEGFLGLSTSNSPTQKHSGCSIQPVPIPQHSVLLSAGFATSCRFHGCIPTSDVQTLAAMLSPFCKQSLRTALLYRLGSLGGLLIPSLGMTVLSAKLWVPAQSHVQTSLYLIAQQGPGCVCMEDWSILGALDVPCASVKTAGAQIPVG